MSTFEKETLGVHNVRPPSITRLTRNPTIAQRIHSTGHKLKERVSYILDHHPTPTEARGDDGVTDKKIGNEDYPSSDESSSQVEWSDSENSDDGNGKDATGTLGTTNVDVSNIVTEEGEGLVDSGWQCAICNCEVTVGHQPNLPSKDATQSGSNVISKPEDPNNPIVLSWCSNCCIVLCDDCWDKAPGHKPQKVNPLACGIRANHHKVPLETASMLASLMTPTSNTASDHVDALESKWFGVTVSQQGDGDDMEKHQGVHLDITSRYRELSMDSKSTEHQFPALVSFIGETGSGKSSLVRALVKVCPLHLAITTIRVHPPTQSLIEASCSRSCRSKHIAVLHANQYKPP